MSHHLSVLLELFFLYFCNDRCVEWSPVLIIMLNNIILTAVMCSQGLLWLRRRRYTESVCSVALLWTISFCSGLVSRHMTASDHSLYSLQHGPTSLSLREFQNEIEKVVSVSHNIPDHRQAKPFGMWHDSMYPMKNVLVV